MRKPEGKEFLEDDKESRGRKETKGRRKTKDKNGMENLSDIFWGDTQVSHLSDIHVCLHFMKMILGELNFDSMKVISDEL